ncbi:MAG TPA: hypothetical protein VFJ97_11145 [Dermatophilaceae bacterium]|nr:hypothetical protein [Dermatophilaceae bacterium]
MAFALVPLLVVVAMVILVGRAVSRVADEADQLRMALVRVNDLRPDLAEVAAGVRRLRDQLDRFGG